MSKARVLADFISDGSTFADGAISVAEVSGAAPLASPTFTGTASGTFSGPLTGNVTGDVTGDLTGDVTGNVTGNLTGNVTGDVAGDIDLSAIAATIADTAVDIFVYDTRKDSDGGAWRKRTQHTSWYNETLNTSTRGSRKEFPAVAVIVAESTQVTIYDGDDPDLPMWMVFNQGYGCILGTVTGYPVSSVTMLNGVMTHGAIYDVHVTNFISDKSNRYGDVGITTVFNGAILDRNTNESGWSGPTTPNIINRAVNDVAMTVLPNAPIDDATGLPIPTIAVATDGGVSVIKDDGSVVDYTYAISDATSRFVTFVDNGIFYLSRNYNNTKQFYGFRYHNIASSDVSGDPDRIYSYQSNSIQMQLTSAINGYTTPLYGLVNSGDDVTIGSSSYSTNLGSGIYKIMDTGTFKEELISHITSSYNTGWMNGDIKLATLSDTDATNVTGSELVTNGTFDTDTSGWTARALLGSTSTLISSSSGTLLVDNNGESDYGVASQSFSLAANTTYVLSLDFLATSNTNQFFLRLGSTGWFSYDLLDQSTSNRPFGSHAFTFTTGGSAVTAYLVLGTYNAGSNDVYFDNVSIRLAEEDRSVNGNGLQVFGTVTKSAVATGADLVGYSPSTTVSNFTQPYNSDLDFGTGDFVFSIWLKQETGTTVQSFMSRGDTAASGNRINNFLAATTREWTIFINGTSRSTSYVPPANTWVKLDAVRRNGVIYAYANGELVYSASEGGSLTNSSAVTVVGGAYTGTQGSTDCSLALARISATAPSPEQIKKIYEDEKVLFQEGAQATLYGSSDAVTALAYDDTTELLHVGTSAGRSVFQGLRRVDNTTTAVGAAISASNGLVADE